ncbi:GNAT family N-acetyltransferase [Thermohalobacter berrensis]|uniref:N-acetyltransferase domain-containing protein n=1 Tax=Thermohalobacter berrensis TaxID=99594 RepID=A0A419TA75_9FIRM|nr:GNAT family N-acetyltransferase [Thermohalobacter berrensis]RKD34384.1 hypothetical protein BET03_00700 [Thermohalobacter berrensis]
MQLETKRTFLKRVQLKDTEKLFKIFSDEELTRYFVSGKDETIEQTGRRVKKIVSHWENNRFGDFIVLNKSSLKTVGFGGLHYKIKGGNINISYIVDKAYWGQGLGYEIAQALLKYGFNTLRLNKIVAEIDPKNISSIKLAEKCGFEYNRTIEYKGIERLEYIMLNPEFD